MKRTLERICIVFFLFSGVWGAVGGCTEDFFINDLGAGSDTDGSGGTERDSEIASECVSSESVESGTSPTIDIIVAVDNSAGMEDEALAVQTHLPDFITRIRASGVDAQLTLISAPTPSDDDKIKNGICLPSPVGSGQCPEDSRSPGYTHIAQSIGSKDALSFIHSTFEQWGGTLRAESQRHFIVVSDDNADVTADEFVGLLAALTPPLDSFYFHTISASADKATACAETPPSPCCDYAAKMGEVYQTLAAQTGGVSVDLCLQAFPLSFENLFDGVISLRCDNEVDTQTVPL